MPDRVRVRLFGHPVLVRYANPDPTDVHSNPDTNADPADAYPHPNDNADSVSRNARVHCGDKPQCTRRPFAARRDIGEAQAEPFRVA